MKMIKLVLRIPIGIILGLMMLIGGYSVLPIGAIGTLMGLISWLGYCLKPTLNENDRQMKKACLEMIFAWPVMSFLTTKTFILNGTFD